MLSQIYGELIKSLLSYRRHKIFSLIAFLPPLLLSFLFISAFTLTGNVEDSSIVKVAIVNEDGIIQEGSWKEKLIDSINLPEGTIPYFHASVVEEEEAISLFNERKAYMIVYIPEGFEDNILANNSVILTVRINNIHEDISKNLRLGLEGRLYQFALNYQLDVGLSSGIIAEPVLEYENVLARSNYMMVGILVMTAIFVSAFYGAVLGVEEKDNDTFTEILIVPHGELYSRIGKIFATLLISLFTITLFIILSFFLYNITFPNIISIIVTYLTLLCLTIAFSVLGVLYGMKIGDFRAVPAPTIIISVVLWLIGGAINPLEFSAGSEFFKLLPGAAAIRILTATMFQRGSQHLNESWLILLFWVAIPILLLLFQLIKAYNVSKE